MLLVGDSFLNTAFRQGIVMAVFEDDNGTLWYECAMRDRLYLFHELFEDGDVVFLDEGH